MRAPTRSATKEKGSRSRRSELLQMTSAEKIARDAQFHRCMSVDTKNIIYINREHSVHFKGGAEVTLVRI